MLYPANSRWNPYLHTGSVTQGDTDAVEMTRRSRFSSVPPAGYYASTRGHSAIRNKWALAGSPSPRSNVWGVEDCYYPDYVPRHRFYDTSREENEIKRNVNAELMYTSNLLDDTYDVAAKSRNRDQTLLRDANRAIVDTETYATPKSSVTSRRVRATSVFAVPQDRFTRAVSCPPSRRSNQVVVIVGGHSFGGPRVFTANRRAATVVREQSPRRASPREQLERRIVARRMIDTVAGPVMLPTKRSYRSMFLPVSLYRPYQSSQSYQSRSIRHYYPTTRDVIPERYPVRVLASPLKRKHYLKAALVGSNVEVTTPRRRHPRSDYAANKLRAFRKEEREHEVEAIPTTPTSSLRASTVRLSGIW